MLSSRCASLAKRGKKCYKNKHEACAAAAAKGHHPSSCFPSRSAGIHAVGVRRPIGDPIDRCVVTERDLTVMTKKQIVAFARREGLTVPKVDPATGREPLKAQIIAAVLEQA
ncbi:MAG: hypothetical protein P4L69_08480, partial [Desulfosporosinus sp.]|nr:hypothetical protein [Desulfosporosinus sp.]